MKTRVLVGVAVSSVALLASCTQDREATPLLPTQASFARPSVGPCVAWSTTNSNAKAYFAQSKDPVFVSLDSMQAAVGAGNATNANRLGYKVLSRLAYAVNAPASSNLVAGTSAQGSTFANNVLGCMTVSGYDATTPIDFGPALSDSGLFAVRSDAVLDAVVSRKRTTNGPLFGAERLDASSTSWYARSGTSPYTGSILFYGAKLADAATFNGEDTASVVFDISSLPSPLSFLKIGTANDTVPTLKAGVCDMDFGAQILHEHGTSAILPDQGAPGFCALAAPPQVGLVRSPFSSFAFAANRVVNWFAPQPLYAFVRIGGSGSYGGLSKGGAVKFNVPQSGITFSSPPATGKLNAADQFKNDIAVQVLSAHRNAIASVKVSLTVSGNSGSFTPPADSVRYTNTAGIATFPDFHLDKAGGYTITAKTQYGSVVSNLFNLTGGGK